MFANSSFYGGQKGIDFKIVKIFPSLKNLKEDLGLGYASTVNLNDYVMISYGFKEKLDKSEKWNYYQHVNDDKAEGNYNATLWQKVFIEREIPNDTMYVKASVGGFAYRFISSFNNDFENSIIIKDTYNFFDYDATRGSIRLTSLNYNNYGVPNIKENVAACLGTKYVRPEGDNPNQELLRSDEIIAVNHFVAKNEVEIAEGEGCNILIDTINKTCYVASDVVNFTEQELQGLTWTELKPFSSAEFQLSDGNDVTEIYKSGDIEKHILKNEIGNNSSIIVKKRQTATVIQTINFKILNGILTLSVEYAGSSGGGLSEDENLICFSYWYYIDESGEWDRVQVTANTNLQQEYTNIEAASKIYSAAYINQLEKSLLGKTSYQIDLKTVFDEEKKDDETGLKKEDRIKYSEFLNDVNNLRVLRYFFSETEDEYVYPILKKFSDYFETSQELSNACLITYYPSKDEMEKEVLSGILHRSEKDGEIKFSLDLVYWQPYKIGQSTWKDRALKSGIITLSI